MANELIQSLWCEARSLLSPQQDLVKAPASLPRQADALGAEMDWKAKAAQKQLPKEQSKHKP